MATKKIARTTKVKRKTVKKTVSSAAANKKTSTVHAEVQGLTIKILDTTGKVKGHMALPKEVFGVKVNKQLIAQAVRVYLANQREGGASTKTRGEVEGSTRKIYRQKGTGKARHGGIRAPIFVGGGIVFGPTPKDYSLTMPVVMKRKALAGALTSQNESGAVCVIDGLESLEKKTKFFAKSLSAASPIDHMLLVITPDVKDILRCCRNIGSLDILPAANLNTYAVVTHKHVVFMKDAVNLVKDIVVKEA